MGGFGNRLSVRVIDIFKRSCRRAGGRGVAHTFHFWDTLLADFFDNPRDNLASRAAHGPTRVDDKQMTGLPDRCQNCVDIERCEGNGVNHFCRNSDIFQDPSGTQTFNNHMADADNRNIAAFVQLPRDDRRVLRNPLLARCHGSRRACGVP